MKINNHRQNRRYFQAAAPVERKPISAISGEPAKPQPKKTSKPTRAQVIRG